MKYPLLTLLALAVLGGCSSSTSNPDAGDAGNDAEAGQSTGGDGGGSDGGGEGDGGSGDGGDAGDGGDDGGNGGDGGDGGGDAGDAGDGGGLDEDACEDVAVECGEIDLGGGTVIDCGNPDGNPTGTDKDCESYETCSANECTCESELELPESERPQCEFANDCTPGGLNLGNCSDPALYPGGNYTCSADRKCECIRTPQSTACAGRACGTAPDGCGGSWECGSACGDGRVCVEGAANATCECDASYDTTAFCADRCGAQTLNGCPVDCGGEATCEECSDSNCSSGCTCTGGQVCGAAQQCCSASDQATLCAGIDCGSSVTDPCTGEEVLCGCGAGESCVEAAYVVDSSVNTCLPEAVANLAGKYAVRTHSFTMTTGVLPDVTRSEVISLVTVTTNAAGDAIELEDQGCIAGTDNADVSNPQRATTLSYSFLPDEYHSLELDLGEGTWIRHFGRNASPPGGPVPTGWISEMPSYCEGGNPPGAGTDGPGLSNGATKSWLGGGSGGTCSCPAPEDVCDAEDLDPSSEGESAGALRTRFAACEPDSTSDCRINDIDHDGHPGLRLAVEGGLGNGARLDVGTVGDIQWAGEVDPYGSHLAFATEPSTVLRAVFDCGGNFIACAGAGSVSDVSCGADFNHIRFTRLLGDELSYECSDFYVESVQEGPDAHARGRADVNRGVYDPLFARRGVRCAGGGPCPCTSNADCASRPGTICHDDDPEAAGLEGHCWPLTSPRACSGEATCLPGWECRTDEACWPAGSEENDCMP